VVVPEPWAALEPDPLAAAAMPYAPTPRPMATAAAFIFWKYRGRLSLMALPSPAMGLLPRERFWRLSHED
jgi:hypothetical protein